MGKKKIVFIGPPGAGKTSLKKVFFEGESSKKILTQTLKPTFGEESIVLNFQEKIGIFDLAGQENETWLQIHEDSVLNNSSIIIVVVDCQDKFESNLEFIKQVIALRDKIVPEGLIYILVHKIDLINDSELYDLRFLMQDRLYYYNHISLAFTSIKRKFFQYTFSLFIDILRLCIQKQIAEQKSDINYIFNSVFFLFLINEGNVISRDELQYTLSLSEYDFKNTESLLLSRQLIKTNQIGPSLIYRLTEKGTSYIAKLFDNFSLENLEIFEKSSHQKSLEIIDEQIKFIGFFIADKSGLPLLKVEIQDGFFEKYLKSEDKEQSMDTDLIIPFISALEMFSSEINIKDFSGLKLKGSNITVQTFNLKDVTISLLADSKANMKAVEEHIKNWFQSTLIKYQKLIVKARNSGERTILDSMAEEGRQFLNDLNNQYNELADNHEIYDQTEIQSLFSILDKLPTNSISKEELNVVRKLKRELIKSSIEKDISSLKDLSKIIREM